MKIKKYWLNILILTALFVVFSPVTKAASGENCSDHEFSTQSQCEGAGFTWTPDSTSNGSIDLTGATCTMGTNPNFQDVAGYATCIIGKSIIPLIFALALVLFLWGVIQFVINGDDEVRKTKGKQFMMWGIIALAVMVSVWGLVKILGKTFNIEYVIPQVKSVPR